ncbi:hypothetical protein B7R54_18040 [Subtercola boreus]|uniref:Solute-binding protein family 3/N-terminal domain-containing protein n=1 Tax=Subtercola boreus TaxID=120213 RepID=A0A3E0VLX1_9MICO|nr:transporter substrate-binding domain-containing protein [Subtercola boreus]RFA10896.1 hypothetical protein B7R54_18040 [Subtercola boreus]TQL55517.1 polar amino acid transport system substrate-binding protein [Subtercola boreus]
MTATVFTRITATIATASAIALLASGCSSTSAGTEAAAADTTGTTVAHSVDESLRALLPKEVLDAGVVNVGAPYVLPPSVGIGDGAEPVGISPDLAAAFGDILGVDFVWRDVKEPIPAIQSGAIDISIGFLSDTPARQQVLTMIDQMQNQSAILVPKENADKVTDIASMCGMTLAVVSGSQQEIRAKTISDAECAAKPITINPFTSAADATTAVQSGRASGFVAPALILANTVKTSGDGSTFALTDARYPDNPFAMGVALDRKDFAAAILGALKILVADGTYHEIMEKHGAADIELTEDQVVINGGGTSAFPID